MYFKNPEILYGLFIIIIPIIVHLFQLQKFKKTPFTNVAFLKKITSNNRQSSQLKKWLILTLRILSFTAIIFAFSQPFFPNKNSTKNSNKNYIYLDNSISMSTKNSRGELLKVAIQDLIENIDINSTTTLITNDDFFTNLDYNELKNTLKNLEYAPNQKKLDAILLGLNSDKNNKTKTLSNSLLISDFQFFKLLNINNFTNVNSTISFIKLTPDYFENTFIDSVFISSKNSTETTLKVLINNTNSVIKNKNISLFINEKLISKTSTQLEPNKKSSVEFSISNQKKMNGKIVLEKENINFDDTYFFNIQQPKKINVFSIGKPVNFLSKIYTESEFNFTEKKAQNIVYEDLKKKHLIILNELEKIPESLSKTLVDFKNNYGDIVIIPSSNINIESYNRLFQGLNIGSIKKSNSKELKITSINYKHPFFNQVFEKSIQNFQYPKTILNLRNNLKRSSPLLSFENNSSFVSKIDSENNTVYWFSSPINNDLSNFQQSPLIVPLFYNFGKYSYTTPKLSYELGKQHIVNITNTDKNDILSISNKNTSFIPIQKAHFNNHTTELDNRPSTNGFFSITNQKNDTLSYLAFNYNKEESNIHSIDLNKELKNNEHVLISNSIGDTFTTIKGKEENKTLFKWFLGLSIVFLLLEIGILKFFKV